MRVLAGTLLPSLAMFALAHAAGPAGAAAPRPAYVALGDSITATGTGSHGWVAQYAFALEQAVGAPPTVENLGTNNWTSAQLLEFVRDDAGARNAIARSDVVTFQIGTNDFMQARGRYAAGTCGGADHEDCLRAMVADFSRNWDQLVGEIRALAPHAMLRTMNIYYPTVRYDMSAGTFGVMGRYLAGQNEHIAANAVAPVADVHGSYNGIDGRQDPYTRGFLLDDDVHPNGLGQVVIAERLRALGFAGLPGARSGDVDPAPVVVAATASAPRAAAGGPAAKATRTSGASASRRVMFAVVAVALIVAAAFPCGWYVRRRARAR